MDEGLLSLTSSLRALTSMQDAVSNNLANIHATAYKRREPVLVPFQSALDEHSGRQTTLPAFQEFTNPMQGNLRQTGNDFHIGLQGEGYLQLRTADDPDTTLYSRNGSLGRTTDGTLVTEDGYLVLGEDRKPIQLPIEGSILIRPSGEIVSAQTGGLLGRIGLVRFDRPEQLKGLGRNLFAENDRSGAPVADRFTRVEQGSLERANVDSMQELVSMITTQRHFGAITRALSTVHDITRQLNQLAQG